MRIVQPRTVISDADGQAELRVIGLVHGNPRSPGAAGVLEQLIQDVVERGVEQAPHLVDGLRGDMGAEGICGHGGISGIRMKAPRTLSHP